jgi:hypothetical protein
VPIRKYKRKGAEGAEDFGKENFVLENFGGFFFKNFGGNHSDKICPPKFILFI